MNDGAAVLDAITGFIKRFVALTPAQAHLVALWIVHTHAKAASDVTPYLSITSTEKQSGKTRLLEVLEMLAHNPWMTGRTSAAALVRKVERGVTLLLDETDAAFQGEKEYSEALRGILNSGHRRGGKASLCVGQGANIDVKDFPVFGPKALAGIGRLPDTIGDRSIPVRLKRKGPTEKVDRFRRRLLDSDATTLRDKVATFAKANIDTLKNARPDLPDQLTDRQQDGIEPLLAIADIAGDTWPARARWVASDIFASSAAEDDSIRVRLLADIRDVLGAVPAGRMLSADLVGALCGIEGGPWAEWNKGRFTPNTLARLLKPFEIGPRTIRTSTDRAKGYSAEMFEDAFSRYLRPLSGDNVTTCINSGCTPLLEAYQPERVTGARSASEPHEKRLVTAVTDEKPGNGDNGDYLFGAAVSLCREAGSVSVTTIKNGLLVSAATAVKYVDQMEEMGLVGPANCGGPRRFIRGVVQ